MRATSCASLPQQRHIQGFRHQGTRSPNPPVPWTETDLSIRVLKTADERSVITKLRSHAPIEAESDLHADAFGLEDLKDRLGMVMAIFLDDDVAATIRFIPSGHGVTLAEKSWSSVTRMQGRFGHGSWEVGRLIVDPKYRSAALLPQCLALACAELIEASDVKFLHASCSPLMARLYRRFGFTTEKVIQGEHGLQHALIHAHIDDVVRALDVSPVSPLEAGISDADPEVPWIDREGPPRTRRAA